MTERIPAPPKGCGPAGKRLWKSVVTDYALAEHERSLLEQAVRVADVCEQLQAVVDRDGPLWDGKAHPALVELRQQRILLTRLVVALRVPLGDEDAQGALRPQYRGTRGVYAIKGVS